MAKPPIFLKFFFYLLINNFPIAGIEALIEEAKNSNHSLITSKHLEILADTFLERLMEE